MTILRHVRSTVNSVLQRAGIEVRRRVPEFIESNSIRFKVTSKTTHKRAVTLLSKEPSTIEWIDSFEPGSVFWDVGANVGVYTLYAAKRSVKVLAFEPAYFNFALLNDNILANDLSKEASAFCIALSDRSELNDLNLSSTVPGSAFHAFANSIAYTGETFIPRARQAMLGMTLDDFCALPGATMPNHLKVDVDGNEHKVLAGGERVLTSPQLRSVMVELNTAWPDQYQTSHHYLEKAGFKPIRAAPLGIAELQNIFFVRS